MCCHVNSILQATLFVVYTFCQCVISYENAMQAGQDRLAQVEQQLQEALDRLALARYTLDLDSTVLHCILCDKTTSAFCVIGFGRMA